MESPFVSELVEMFAEWATTHEIDPTEAVALFRKAATGELDMQACMALARKKKVKPLKGDNDG